MLKHEDLLKGEISCTRCNQKITWVYKYLDPNQREFIVLEKVKNGESIVNYNKQTNTFKVNCPHKGIRDEVCGQLNNVEELNYLTSSHI